MGNRLFDKRLKTELKQYPPDLPENISTGIDEALRTLPNKKVNRYNPYFRVPVGIALLFCLIFAVSLIRDSIPGLRVASVKELRAKYPAYSGFSPNANVFIWPFEEVLKDPEAHIIVGEVVGDTTKEEVPITLNPGTPEKKIDDKLRSIGMNPSHSIEVSYTKVRVLDNITANKIRSREITIFQVPPGDYEFIQPLKPGMKAVFVLSDGTDRYSGKYALDRYHSFYVTEDDYVLSMSGFGDKYSGMRLKNFEKEIKKLEK
ncbi:MAG: hypothetical protein Q8930_05875 [Bacillota bacterium]|nr:hypothetical protein [Bacillota bacterium]